MQKAESTFYHGETSLSSVYSYCFYCYCHNKVANIFKLLSPFRRLIQGNLDLNLDSGLVLGKGQ